MIYVSARGLDSVPIFLEWIYTLGVSMIYISARGLDRVPAFLE